MGHGYREDRGQAAWRDAAQQRRPPARGDGDLQRVLRPRAGLSHRRQHARCHERGGRASSGCTASQDVAAMVRDCVKWDDVPASLTHFAESAVRAYKIAMTPPTVPVLIVADGELQERPVETSATLRVPKLSRHRAAAGRLGRRGRSGAAARGRGDARPRRRSRRADAGRDGAARRARRGAAGAGRRPMGPAEFSDAPSAQPLRQRARADCRRRCRCWVSS